MRCNLIARSAHARSRGTDNEHMKYISSDKKKIPFDWAVFAFTAPIKCFSYAEFRWGLEIFKPIVARFLFLLLWDEGPCIVLILCFFHTWSPITGSRRFSAKCAFTKVLCTRPFVILFDTNTLLFGELKCVLWSFLKLITFQLNDSLWSRSLIIRRAGSNFYSWYSVI